jgi:rhodanese-related sulfurtransferase
MTTRLGFVWALVLALGIIAAASVWGQLGFLFRPDVPVVGVETLARAVERGELAMEDGGEAKPFLLVDVRDDNELAVSMLPGAVTLAEYERSGDRYAGHRIVPYCTVGYRSGKYTEKLLERGVDAVNFEGSVMAWVEAGQSLVTPSGKDTRRVHTWSRHIKAPPGYVQVVD